MRVERAASPYPLSRSRGAFARKAPMLPVSLWQILSDVHCCNQILEQWRAEAQAYLDHTADRLRGLGQQADTRICIGPPAFAILDYARDHSVDLIALATHGRGGLTRMLLGSVADKVVRGASIPVLLQRPSAEKADQPKANEAAVGDVKK